MARGGYVSSRVAITRLAKAIGDRTEATRLIEEALVSEGFKATGQRQVNANPASDDDANGKMVLRDISAPDPAMTLSKREKIRVTFWRGVRPEDRAGWDLEAGFVSASPGSGDGLAYQELRLAETDLSQLINLHRVQDAKRERERRSDWAEWVAALVSLAHEHRINAHTSQTTLLDLISERLAKWKLPSEGKPPSTVSPVLRKVLERYKTNPPHPPEG